MDLPLPYTFVRYLRTHLMVDSLSNHKEEPRERGPWGGRPGSTHGMETEVSVMDLFETTKAAMEADDPALVPQVGDQDLSGRGHVQHAFRECRHCPADSLLAAVAAMRMTKLTRRPHSSYGRLTHFRRGQPAACHSLERAEGLPRSPWGWQPA
jgi:hypothetical protein